MKKMYDAIIILSGGIAPKGNLPTWVKARADLALKYFTGKEYIICTTAYTVHKKTMLGKNGLPITEAQILAAYLKNKGLAENKLLLEKFSLDTIGNAYFSKILFCEPLKLKKLLIITSAFHMPRSQKIFAWIFNLKPKKANYQLSFLSSESKGLNDGQISARLKKENQSALRVAKNALQIKTTTAFTKWLFLQHNAYNIKQKMEKIDLLTKKSY